MEYLFFRSSLLRVVSFAYVSFEARSQSPRRRLRGLDVSLPSRESARVLIPPAAVLPRPLQHLEVAALRRARARPLVPRAAVRARPLQHLEVAALRRPRTRPPVPRAFVLARPLQHLKVAALRRVRARPPVPRAAVLTQPLQHLEVPALRRVRARRLVPRVAVLTQPLQQREAAVQRRVLARRPVPRKIRRSQRLQLLEISVYRCCGKNESPLNALQKTSRVPVLQQAHVSEAHRFPIRPLLDLAPRRVHRVAHPVTHRAEPTEVRGLWQKVRSENVRGDHVGGKAPEAESRGVGIVVLRHSRGHR